jgi:prolyl oligopeptidase
MKKLTFSLILALLPVVAVSQENAVQQTSYSGAKIHYPYTKTVDSVDVLYGQKIPDPYRWLEQSDTTAAVKNWIAQENRITDRYFSKIPFRKKLGKEMTDFVNFPRITAPFRSGEYYYFSKNTGLQNQNVWYRTKNPEDPGAAEVFLNPNKFYDHGAFTFQNIYFTNDGSYCVYTLSPQGSDWRVAIVKNTRTGEQVGDTIRNLKFTNIAWKGDDGFYYSTYKTPKGKNRLLYKNTHQTLFYHKLGTPQSQDRFVFGGEKNPNRYIQAVVTKDGHYLEIMGANTNNNKLYIKDLTRKDAPIVPVVADYNSEQYVVDNNGSTLFIYTNRDAPNYRLVKVDASDPSPKNWVDVIPEKKNPLSITTAGGYFFANYIKDVKDVVYQYDYNGNKIRKINLPAAGTATGFQAQKKDSDLYFTFTSFTYPNVIYHYNIKTGKTDLYWKPKMNFNPDDYVAKQVFYRSKDGTKIPMYIVYKRGLKRNGKNPLYLTGYGGFGISLMPRFIGPLSVWLDHGGIFAQPNLRGGSEYGKEWHLAGVKMHKQNVFDDFIAAAEYLIKKNYTSSDYLAIAGGSNGGLLVGATMTQRPDLMKVALPSVGVLDMLRYNKFTGGAGWAFDYGTAEDSKKMFEYLLSYSPLQNVKKGMHYPATLVWTADHDDRVVPAHSFKFTATLQADNAGGNPTLLKVKHNIGHGTGMTLTQGIDYLTNQLAFAWYNMGINPFKQTDLTILNPSKVSKHNWSELQTRTSRN